MDVAYRIEAPEPPDGVIMVMRDFRGDYSVIWRDDAEAASGTFPEERWFDSSDSDPMGWRETTKYATDLYRVAGTPYASVRPAAGTLGGGSQPRQGQVPERGPDDTPAPAPLSGTAASSGDAPETAAAPEAVPSDSGFCPHGELHNWRDPCPEMQ